MYQYHSRRKKRTISGDRKKAANKNLGHAKWGLDFVGELVFAANSIDDDEEEVEKCRGLR